jgi:hypothetical protein
MSEIQFENASSILGNGVYLVLGKPVLATLRDVAGGRVFSRFRALRLGRLFSTVELTLVTERLDRTESPPKERLCIVGCSVSDISAPVTSLWHRLSA